MKIRSVAIASVGMALLSAGLAAPAMADVHESDCLGGYVCLFDDANFGGGRLLKFRDVNRTSNLPDWNWNDHMSSWKNRHAMDAKWYYDINRGGKSLCMNGGTKSSYVGGEDNDKASSVFIYNSREVC